MASISPDNHKPSLQTQPSYWETAYTRFSKLVVHCFKTLTIEPFIFLWAFGVMLTVTPSYSLYFDKVCKVGSTWFGDGSHWSDDICDHVDNGTFGEIQNYVQGVVADMHLVVSVCQSIPPVIFILFIGPWSDNFGRKTLLILPVIGYLYYSMIFLFSSIFFYELPPEFLLLEIFKDFFGSQMCLWMGAYSYMADISSFKTRTMRIAFIDMFFSSAATLSMGVSGIILINCGYISIYAISTSFFCVALLYCLLIVKESKQLGNEKDFKHIQDEVARKKAIQDAQKKKEELDQKSTFSKIKLIFNLKNIKQSFSTALKKRQHGMRHIICLLILMYGLFGMANGVGGVANQYARKKFEWSSSDDFNIWWSTYSSVGTLFVIFAIAVLMPIMTQYLKLSDTTILLLASASTFAGHLTTQLAEVANILYLASALKLFSDISTVTARSALTKAVGPLEVGRVFACVGAMGAVVTLINPMYQAVYSATIEWYFGFVYCIADMVSILMIVISLYMCLFMRRYKRKGYGPQTSSSGKINPQFTESESDPASQDVKLDSGKSGKIAALADPSRDSEAVQNDDSKSSIPQDYDQKEIIACGKNLSDTDSIVSALSEAILDKKTEARKIENPAQNSAPSLDADQSMTDLAEVHRDSRDDAKSNSSSVILPNTPENSVASGKSETNGYSREEDAKPQDCLPERKRLPSDAFESVSLSSSSTNK